MARKSPTGAALARAGSESAMVDTTGMDEDMKKTLGFGEAPKPAPKPNFIDSIKQMLKPKKK